MHPIPLPGSSVPTWPGGRRGPVRRGQPQAARRGSPDVLMRRAVENRTTTQATAAATPTAAGGSFSAIPPRAHTVAAP